MDDVTEKLLHILGSLEGRFRELESHLQNPAALGSAYAGVVREHGRLSQLMGSYKELTAAIDALAQAREMLGDPEMKELAELDIAENEEKIPALVEELKGQLVQGDQVAARNALLEIRAGTGGEEAALFAGDLVRMYTLHAQKRGWQIAVIDLSEAEQGGVKEAVLEVKGEGVFGLLRFESGGHRVQRVPATESQGRIHTSAATVAVMPEAEEVDLQIDPGDLTIERKRAGGAGGQHVNKTESAIRITHNPTGVVAQCQDEKSQNSNLDKAMKVLRSRLYERMIREAAEKRAAERKGQVGSGDRSDRVRTYNFPQNRITDHRINVTTYNLDKYIEGNIEELQQAMIDDAKLRVLEEWSG